MNRISRQQGFSLLEMAIVLAIVGLLMAGLLPTLSGQMEQQRRNETTKQLDEIKEALIGYAIINGRLPCPASTSSAGAESFDAGGSASNGDCSNFNDGFLPAATLGVSPTDSEGFAIDPWGNRIRYAVTSADSNAFTTTSGMSTTGISNLSPDLIVCSSASSSSSSCSVSNTTLTTTAPAVIYSTGLKLLDGNDEDENQNTSGSETPDRVFVSHTPTSSGASNGEFDDLVVWLSSNVLINRMVTAGKLP